MNRFCYFILTKMRLSSGKIKIPSKKSIKMVLINLAYKSFVVSQVVEPYITIWEIFASASLQKMTAIVSVTLGNSQNQ